MSIGILLGRSPRWAFRSPEEIDTQFVASRLFAPAVATMPRISHQYTAGQAAALAWLVRRGPAPLTFGATAPVSGPSSVQRLTSWAHELMARPGDSLFPCAYVIGVEQVCRWVQRLTDLAPFPLPPAAAPPRPRHCGLRRLP
jgi:hypothetical protein